MDNTFKSPRTISFCTGIRGLERGLERVIGELRVVCYVEREAVVAENLAAEMEAGEVAPAPIWTDARTFPTHLFRGCVDLVMGGYPCQGESLAGKRELENYPGYLWPPIREAVRTIRPLFCFFENVDDHLTGTFRYVIQDLHDMGYAVEAGVFSAEEVGAPHERQRVFILAVDNAYSERLRQKYEICSGRNSAELASEKLENTTNRRFCGLCVFSQQSWGTKTVSRSKNELGDSKGNNKCGKRIRGQGNQQKIKAGRSGDDQELAHPHIRRQQQRVDSGMGREREQTKKLCNTVSAGWQSVSKDNEQKLPAIERANSIWPSGPGQPQHEWEYPRTITREAESNVGFSVDGYSFREDFLRALGNAVVPDQAELAFRTLIKKFS